ncbi:MAG: hypothetical protein JST73_00675 [Actinobacteria bacterium]|nr:hypothetical protein [Actinomycetota bacterium]
MTTADPQETRRRIELDVRNVVLGLGVTCLFAAAASFVAVSWDSFDASMRAALLVGATVATFVGGIELRRRGFSGTATALSWLTAVLAFVDLFAIQRAAITSIPTSTTAAIGGMVLFALFVASTTWRRDAAMTTGAVIAWLLGSMSALSTWNVTGPDVWVLPSAAVIAWLQWRATAAKLAAGSWERYGLALVVAAVPAVATALGDPNLARPLIVIALATLVLVAGVQFRHFAAVWVGGMSLGVLVSAYLVDALRGVPGWAVFAGVGMVLLGLGAFIDRRIRAAARLDTHDGRSADDLVATWR